MALRYPNDVPKDGEKKLRRNKWHVDAMDDKGICAGFSLLCGIVLSHWKDEFYGNFTGECGTLRNVLRSMFF